MSTHLQTHPWIDFKVDMRQASTNLWRFFGEAISKCEHLAGVPMMPDIAHEMHEVFLAKGVHATAAIEGNTLREDQVLQIVKNERIEDTVAEYAVIEVENILRAANDLLSEIEANGESPISVADVKGFNRQVLSGLEVDEHVFPGQLTKVQVGVPGYRGCSPEDCPQLLGELCNWLNGPFFKPSKEEDQILFGLIKAVFAHLYLVWIHPFGDGNGRTARLLEVKFLLEAGVPSAAAHLLSNHYNRTRPEYIRRLDAASKNEAEVYKFLEYAISGFVKEIRGQIGAVKLQQWNVLWVNFIHRSFQDEDGFKSKRQRKLMLEINKIGRKFHRKEVSRISAETVILYEGKTPRTIDRDLDGLVARNLLKKEKNNIYRSKNEMVLQFLPRGKQGMQEAQVETAMSLMVASDYSDTLDLFISEN